MKHALAITLVLLGVPHAARAAADPPAIVVATIASGDVVYALDAESGQVSFAAVPAQLPASIPLDAMTGLELPRGIRVAAMGLRRDRLIFVDVGGKRPALREMELQSGAIYDVRTDADFQRPIALAVSPSGEIAVADQTRRAMLWLRDQEPSQAVPWPDGVARLAQVQFDGRSLVGLDADSGRIVGLAPPALTKQIAPPVQISEAPLAGLRAFAVFRGIYYLSNGTALFVLAPRGVPRRLPCATCSPAVVRATARHLYVYHEASREIAIRTRPVPIGMSIETNAADGQRALASFYAYLADRGMLALRDYAPPRAFGRVVDALRDAGAIFPDPDADGVPAALAAAICGANPGPCRDAGAYASGPIAAGAPLRVPDYTIQRFVRPDTVDLHGTTVAALLQSVRAFDANAGRLENVQSLNAASFENALARQGLVVASPARGDIVPGTFITLRDGAERAGRDLAAVCDVRLETLDRPTPIDIPDRVSRVAFKDFVPLGTNPDGSPKDLGVKDGDLYGMSFRRTKIQQLDAGSAGAPGVAARLTACMKRLAARPAAEPEPLLVVEALRVEGALYDFSAPPRRASIEQPYYLAYRAVPVSAFEGRSVSDAFAQSKAPAALKPGGLQDLLSRRTGTIELPVLGWSLNALVPADDFDDPESPLHRIARVPEGRILFLSREVIATAAKSSIARANGDPPQLLNPAIVKEMQDERKALLAAIEYRDLARESAAPLKIGLGEAGVYLNHSAMTEMVNGVPVSAFLTQSSPDQPFRRHQAVPVASAPRRQSFAIGDHGVHVAGLLGARESAVLPGLLPHADLFVIDTSSVNPSDLHKSIDQAAAQGVKVFNLSLDFNGFMPDTEDEIRRDFKNKFERQLFIVAAGNDGLDLADHRIPPIAWMHDVRSHMIGVGMSTHDGTGFQREGRDPDKGPDARKSVSNVGREYIQLAAPGEGIFSLGSDNNYTDATGTSQAAPQVAAAAAMLAQAGDYTANQIKARLIYTATWLEARDYIWGGRLNIHRAVWSPGRNLYIGRSNTTGPPISAEFEPTMVVSIGGNKQTAEPDGPPAVAPDTIPFTDVLRLTTLEHGAYRVHYIDRNNGNRLRIIEEAEVHGVARFVPKSTSRWDPERKEFVDVPAADEGRDISEFIYDYVARLPNVCGNVTGVCNPTIVF